jgi:phospholipid/cholesterol/gamma-HCH transport system substrate-binding protein
MKYTERSLTIVTGLVTAILMVGTTYVAVLYSSGTFDDVYKVQARFSTAGQGLIKQSDVKVRGVNIGRVETVALVDGEALVTMRIDGDERIPVGSRAVVRPKTLFGEKFVDIEVDAAKERRGPFLTDGDRITSTVAGYELERVLVTAQKLLASVDPADLTVIVDTLAESSRGQGERIRRQIGNWAAVADVFARHDADTRQFLDDLEVLAASFDRSADNVVGLSRELNSSLPTLNAERDRIDDLLDGAADVARYAADIFERNRPTLEKAITEGGKTLAVVHEHRDELPDLLVALRDFARILARAGEFQGNAYELPDGTLAGTIKLVSNEEGLLALVCSLLGDHTLCETTGDLLDLDDLGTSTGASGSGGGTVAQPPVRRGPEALANVLAQMVTGVPVPVTDEAAELLP